MTHDEFNAFCRGLPATSYVMQWRGSHVWKVGGKLFAIGLRNNFLSGLKVRDEGARTC